jgi:hypothetical protein
MHVKFLVEELLPEREWDKLSKDSKKLINMLLSMEDLKKLWQT